MTALDIPKRKYLGNLWPLILGRELANDERAVVLRRPQPEVNNHFNLAGFAILFNVPASSLRPVNLGFCGAYRYPPAQMELDGVDNDLIYTGLRSLPLKKAFGRSAISMVALVNDEIYERMKTNRPDLIVRHTRQFV